MALDGAIDERDRIRWGHTDRIVVTVPREDAPGGVIRFEGLDRIEEHPDARHIVLAGLRQRDLERFTSPCGHPSQAIAHRWRRVDPHA